MTTIEEEVDRNYEAFAACRDDLLRRYPCQWALLRHGEVQGVYPNEGVALKTGRLSYDDGIYSVQEITDRPVDLGFFSHAIHPRLA